MLTLCVLIKTSIRNESPVLMSVSAHPHRLPNNTWRPTGPVDVVIGYPLGGGSDIIGRPILDELSDVWGQPIHVHNKPGSNGVLAAVEISDARPNGHVVLLGHASSNAVAPAVLDNPDTIAKIEALKPIGRLATQAHVLILKPDAAPYDLGQFIEAARVAKQPVAYGSTGHGSMQQLIAEHFFRRSGLKATHHPYLGSTPAMADLRAGKIDCIFEGLVPAMPFIEDGVFQAVALSSAQSTTGLSIPTLSNLGYPDFDMRSWWGLFAPKDTPSSIVDGWYQGLRAAVHRSRLDQFTQSLGFELALNTPEEFDRFIASERLKYAQSALFLELKLVVDEFSVL
jgi:tripartite-type tricarboxylate transporter receptor subunit TctC